MICKRDLSVPGRCNGSGDGSSGWFSDERPLSSLVARKDSETLGDPDLPHATSPWPSISSLLGDAGR